MSEAIIENHPSRQVERIREILVGRQLESVEKRLNRLEMQLHPRMMPLTGDVAFGGPDVFDIRLEKIEQSQRRDIQELRREIQTDKAAQTEELKRLAQQIQNVSRARSGQDTPAYEEMEGKIGTWLESWQDAWNRRLLQRDEKLVDCVRDECQRLKSWVEEKMEENHKAHGDLQAMRTTFAQLAQAARAFADAAVVAPTPAPANTKLGVLPTPC
jgi:hypothetical protein